MLTLTIVGLDAIRERLGRDLTPELSALTMAVAAEIQDKLAPYPAATAANFPVYHVGPHKKPANYGRWYTRGYGPQWSRKDGSIGGRATSEQLGQQWGMSASLASRSSTTLFNRATYAKWLHSHDERTGWAQERGWVSDKEAVDKVVASGVAEQMAADMVAKVFGG